MNNQIVKLGTLILVLVLISCSAQTDLDANQITSANDVQRITFTDAKALLDAGDAVLYDTRSNASYRVSHARGAISLPAFEVEERYQELPTDKALIFYCA
ncbi:MAG: hypothetical protein GF350_05550 [Chitinivibrionales bacterium]|nr:hypothetical protein [Chitinivibrionales bacterium]